MNRPIIIALLSMSAAVMTAATADHQSPFASQEAYPASSQQTPTPTDRITFGEKTSEQAHSLTATLSESVDGAMGLPARRLIAGGDKAWTGGSLDFKIRVDPVRQNYVTVKFWGSDKGTEKGRLIMYLDGRQLGYDNEGDHDVLCQTDEDALAPGRFVYITQPLPTHLTEGRDSVNITITAFGPKWPYGSYWSQFQKPFTGPSRDIYGIYSHINPTFIPGPDEPRGNMPERVYRKDNSAQVVAAHRKKVCDYISGFLAKAPGYKPAARLKSQNNDLGFLAEIYSVEWTPAYHNPAVVDMIIANGDKIAAEWAYDHRYIEDEWSALGYLGRAIKAAWPEIEPKLDETISVGRGTMTRRQAWTDMFKASVDFWRKHRRSYTNQSMLVDLGIYCSNLGLELLAPELALPEEKTLGYLYQAAGITPWVGNDIDDSPDGRVSEAPYGNNYHLVTRKGLGRELGWVGTYGETDLTFLREMVELTGDDRLRDQLALMQRARMPFRYPGYDNEGFACMKLCSEIDNRTAHFPLNGSAYSQPAIGEAWWMEVPAAIPGDSIAVGAAQMSVKEGQYSHYIANRPANGSGAIVGMMRNIDEYNKVMSLPKVDFYMPMEPGQSDFVFADEEDGIVAIKHGDEILYVNLYYRAERGINRVARILDMTPDMTRLATVITDVEFDDSGFTSRRNDFTHSTRGNSVVAPDSPVHQAWFGEELPIARRPEGATQPEYGSWGPFLGVASFYSVTYSGYHIGMNTTSDCTFTLKLPDGDYTDIATGKRVHVADGSYQVAPLSTIVLIARH